MKAEKVLSILLAAVMLLGLLAGCGSSSSDSETDTAEQTAETSAAAEEEETEEADTEETETEETGTVEESAEESASEEETETEEQTAAEEETSAAEETAYFPLDETETISMWISYPPIGVTPEEYLIFTEAQERLNITLDFQSASLLSASDEFNLMIASGEYPDIINYFSTFYTKSAETALEEEIILDLTDVIEEYAPNYQAARTVDEETAEDTLDDGKVLRFFMMHSGEYSADFGPAVRQDWLEELGLDAPETYDDLYDVLVAFQDAYGVVMDLPATGTVQGSYLSSGYDITLPDENSSSSGGFFQINGTIHYGPYEDSFQDYLEMLNQWYEEGLIYQDFFSSTSGNATDSGLITSSEVGVFWLSAQYITEYESQMGMSDIILPLSDFTQESGQVTHMRLNSSSAAGSVVISTDCENVELAVRFMDWWYTDEGCELANYGVEGVTFEYGENGEILWTELITDNADYSLDAALALYTASRDTMPYVYDDTKYNTLYSDIQVEAGQIWLCNDDGAYAMPEDFSYDEDEDALTLMGDIATYVAQCTLQFITGAMDLSEFEDYQANLENMGIQTVLDSYTALYEENYG